MNLLVFNLGMDVRHTALGFTTSWTNALARRCDHVSVITMFKGELGVRRNVTVHSLGKEHGWSEPRRLVHFYRLVHKVLDERRIDACFAHMAPLFSALFAPVAKATRIPVLLWYAHGAVPPTLRVAHALADRCVTSTPSGFRLKSDKLSIVGQGIDTTVFTPPLAPPPDRADTAISVGRISATKRIEEMLATIAILRHERGVELRLEVTGEALTRDDARYAQTLKRETESLGVTDAVTFTGRVPFTEISSRYHRGGIYLNLSENKSLDKAILESMAAGCIPISRNESFQRLAAGRGLGWLVPGSGPEGLADCIAAVRALQAEERSDLSDRLRTIVEQDHSLESLSHKLIAHLQELVAASACG